MCLACEGSRPARLRAESFERVPGLHDAGVFRGNDQVVAEPGQLARQLMADAAGSSTTARGLD